MTGIIVCGVGLPFVGAATSSTRVALRAEIVSQATLSTAVTESAGNRRTAIPAADKRGANVIANARTGSSPVTLTLVACNDSQAGMEIIPAAFVTARKAGEACNFLPADPGKPNRTSSSDPVPEQGCSGSYTETFNLYLSKTSNCATGAQPVTVTYTLSSP